MRFVFNRAAAPGTCRWRHHFSAGVARAAQAEIGIFNEVMCDQISIDILDYFHEIISSIDAPVTIGLVSD